MRYLLYISLLIIAACSNNDQANKAIAKHPPFWNDIQKFKKQDSISFPPKHAILFIGSSSFTKWTDVQNYFPGFTIINRGFGGSTLLDQIRYADDIIFPYKPRQIIIYCGENDLASSDTVTATIVFDRFKQLFQMITAKTEAPIAFISMKPSPSRRHLFEKMQDVNAMIRKFIEFHNNGPDSRYPSAFIEVNQKMLNNAGEPMPEIFLDDSLHMNAKGYVIWQKEIQPYLIKD